MEGLTYNGYHVTRADGSGLPDPVYPHNGVIEHLDHDIQPGTYRTRAGHTAVVEGRDDRRDWPIYGRIEWWELGNNGQWKKRTRRERWRPDGGWGETEEPFELDLVVGEEVAA